MRRSLFYVLLLSSLKALSQDMIYDMSYGNRLSLNPAFAGNDGQGKYRVSMFHHNQYANNRGPFNFSNVSLDYGVCNSPITLGLIAQTDVQGDGFLRTTSFSPIIGSVFQVPNGTISFGMQASFINYSVDWNKYVFADQLNPIYGYTGNPSSNSSAGTINDFTTGLSGGINCTHWTGFGAWNLGISGSNIVRPRFSLLDYSNKLPTRWTIHGAILKKTGQYKNKIDNAIEITSRLDIQDVFRTFVGSGGWYANQFFYLGVGGRISSGYGILRNSLKPIIECRIMPKESVRIQLSYGFNVASNSSGLGNAFEIGLTYVPGVPNCNPINMITNIWSKNKKNSRTGRQKVTCPVFQNAKIGTGTF
jgi:type IX secretion system PorP/SprF family membrane protein